MFVVGAVGSALMSFTSVPANAFAEPEATSTFSDSSVWVTPVNVAAAKKRARNTCYEGYLCLYKGPNLTGAMLLVSGQQPDLRNVGFNNDIESFWNRQGVYKKMHEDVNCSGGFNGASTGEAKTLADAWKNRISSICYA